MEKTNVQFNQAEEALKASRLFMQLDQESRIFVTGMGAAYLLAKGKLELPKEEPCN